MGVRKELYSAMLKQSVGWFDKKTHTPGVLSNLLSSETQILNVVSTEAVAAILESIFALICS